MAVCAVVCFLTLLEGVPNKTLGLYAPCCIFVSTCFVSRSFKFELERPTAFAGLAHVSEPVKMLCNEEDNAYILVTSEFLKILTSQTKR